MYDYQLQDGRVSSKQTDDDDEETTKKDIGWLSWMHNITVPKIDPETKYSDIIVPTMDLVRGSFLVRLLTTNSKKVQYFLIK